MAVRRGFTIAGLLTASLQAAGMQNAAGHLATVVAPWLTGWLVEPSGRFHAPVQVAGLVLILGVFAYGVLVRR